MPRHSLLPPLSSLPPNPPPHLHFIKKIGQGACCDGVWKARDERNGLHCAVKVIPKSKHSPSELHILSSLSHPNIIKLISHHETSTHLFLITEFCDCGSLKDLLLSWHRNSSKNSNRLESRLSYNHNERQIAHLFYQIVMGVKYLWEQRVCHRDLKLGNILYTSCGLVQIADFGLSHRFTSRNAFVSHPGGTLQYLPPEFFLQHKQYLESDQWSLGVILYVMLCGEYPFRAESTRETQRRICEADFRPLADDISTHARELVNYLLQVDHFNRLDYDAILAHPFLTKHVDPHAAQDATTLYSGWFTPLTVRHLPLAKKQLSSGTVEMNLFGELTIYSKQKKELFVIHEDGCHFSLWKDDICLCSRMCINFAPQNLKRYLTCAQQIVDRVHQECAMFEMRFGSGNSCTLMRNKPTPNARFTIHQHYSGTVYRILYLSHVNQLVIQSPSPVRTIQLPSDLLSFDMVQQCRIVSDALPHESIGSHCLKMKHMLKETLACCPFVQ